MRGVHDDAHVVVDCLGKGLIICHSLNQGGVDLCGYCKVVSIEGGIRYILIYIRSIGCRRQLTEIEKDEMYRSEEISVSIF